MRQRERPSPASHTRDPRPTTELGSGIAQTAPRSRLPGPQDRAANRMSRFVALRTWLSVGNPSSILSSVKWGHLNYKAEVFVGEVNGTALARERN